MTTPPSLRNRIRNGTLLMLAFTLIVGSLAIPSIRSLGRAIRDTLYRNYISIEAAQHMHTALYAVELAGDEGSANAALAPNRGIFNHWINVELGNITEPGEGALAADIQQRGQRLFGEIALGQPTASLREEFTQLHQRLDDLIAMNQEAMFRADSRANRLSERLAYEFIAGLLSLLILGAVLSWTIAWNLSKPLAELSDHLRSFSLRGPSVRLGQQSLSELQTVAVEFNRMAERLEQFEKLNVDRLIYEKSKTEAIIESIEDGIVLIDPKGIVTHVNELGALILGVDREEALGSPFDDLNSSHPHYMKIRSALAGMATEPGDLGEVEVDLHLRGRDHTFLLKSVPLRQGEGQSFGTILILQDITYLRDKDRARTNLVATLSHELNTPLTSLALAIDLLERGGKLNESQTELVLGIKEDLTRMRNLARDLLDLARGEGVAITLHPVPMDLRELLGAVTRTFALQAEQKHVALTTSFARPPLEIRADPVKLSWVISNLIANALRYTPAGGSVSVESEISPEVVRLRVSDTGPGIPPEVRDRLFERFVQWTVNGTEPGAAGLGLAIAMEIVEAHGGRIFVDSALGRGTCFTVELPAEPEDRWQDS
jgi:two-component system, NtrC family, sensor histidine kinase KinB